MILRLEHFYIEAIQLKDAWGICDLINANEDYFKAYVPKTVEQNLTPTLSQLFVDKKVKQFLNDEEYLFILKDITTKKIIGLVYIKSIDASANCGEFAYCLDYNFTGKSITSTAVKALANYAYQNLNLNTFKIIAHKSNTASIRVAEKCGFTWQSTLKDEFTSYNGKTMDMELYVLKK